ncbi:MAG TPA: hypothetical protein VGQ83_16375 [Polyangia bacterium]|jgi:hypothetical protein
MVPSSSRFLVAAALAVALAVAFLGGARAAAADERAVVWSVSATGDGAAALREQFSRSVSGGLAAAGLAVVPRAEIERRLAAAPGLVGCETSPCLKRVAELLGVTRLVRVRIEVFGSSYVFRLEQLGPDGGPRGAVDGRCDVCTIPEANEQLSHAALRLGRTAAARRPAPPVPAPAPAPTAAPVAAAPARPAPTPAPVPVGPAVSLTVTPAAGPADGAEPPALAPREVPPPPGPEPRRSLRTWKWAAAGAATALVLVGAILVAYDGQGACTAKPGGACPRVYDTGSGGWTMATLGLVAGAGAGALFWWDRAAAPAPGAHRGAGIGYGGRF